MATKLRYRAFSFADERSVEGPAAHETRLSGLYTLVVGMLAFTAALMLISALLTYRLIKTADIEAYVADGGIYGCKVPEWDGKVRRK